VRVAQTPTRRAKFFRPFVSFGGGKAETRVDPAADLLHALAEMLWRRGVLNRSSFHFLHLPDN
jgi:hypothetical protein